MRTLKSARYVIFLFACFLGVSAMAYGQARTLPVSETPGKVIVLKINIPERGNQWMTANEPNGAMVRLTRDKDNKIFGVSPLILDEAKGTVGVKIFQINPVTGTDGETHEVIKVLDMLTLSVGAAAKSKTDPTFEVRVEEILTVDQDLSTSAAQNCGSAKKQAAPADGKILVGCCVTCGGWTTCDCCVADYCDSCCRPPCCGLCRKGEATGSEAE